MGRCLVNTVIGFSDSTGVEGDGELGVAVADQELGRRCSLGEPEAEVPGLLGHPGAGWVRRDTGEMDDPGVQFDEEQDIEPAEQDGDLNLVTPGQELDSNTIDGRGM